MAAFYLDRGIYWWGTYVERQLDEAEHRVRKQMKNRKGTEAFVESARIAAYNKIFGLSPASAYRSVGMPSNPAESSDGTIDLSVFNAKDKGPQ